MNGWRLKWKVRASLTVACFVFTFTGLHPAGVEAGEPVSQDGGESSRQDAQQPPFEELLEFMGEWETEDGIWIDPADTEWMFTPEQDGGNRETKDP